VVRSPLSLDHCCLNSDQLLQRLGQTTGQAVRRFGSRSSRSVVVAGRAQTQVSEAKAATVRMELVEVAVVAGLLVEPAATAGRGSSS